MTQENHGAQSVVMREETLTVDSAFKRDIRSSLDDVLRAHFTEDYPVTCEVMALYPVDVDACRCMSDIGRESRFGRRGLKRGE